MASPQIQPDRAAQSVATTSPLAAKRDELLRNYRQVRSVTEALCEPLAPEDMVVQSMPDVSPTKWHLAHTTWFFEKLVLARSGEPYEPFDERLDALFNSYYQSLGQPFPRTRRGLLSRPTVAEVRAYRRHVDEAVVALLRSGSDQAIGRVARVIGIGLEHEQQHQELMLMDIKHVLAQNPLQPGYLGARLPAVGERLPGGERAREWIAFAGGEVTVGATGDGFCYDNERPQHRVLLQPFELASRLVTCGEFADFIADGGYERPELWLSDGWDAVQREGWRAPLYWEQGRDGQRLMTLRGWRAIDRAEPVCHVSFFEANAFAAWAGYRLPTEFEWEHAAESQAIDGAASGAFLESQAFHPTSRATADAGDVRAGDAPAEEAPVQLFGDVWEWTSSPYSPYPGYRPFEGELGEYNGKFMVNQIVLRGGCCVTPLSHARRTYRNFYYPHQRWMFAGLRLAR